MTFSIVALDEASGMFGVAVATAHLAVGALVPHARSGLGALATQATTNPLYGVDGLALLEDGHPAKDVVDRLTTGDRGREHRQLHVVDRNGATAAWTGNDTIAWSGHRSADGFSVAGNMLVGPAVLTAMVDAYESAPGTAFPRRLLHALEAGERAGGDKRGRQSAALLVVAGEPYAAVDLRVDHNTADPLAELSTLLAESERPQYTNFRARIPTRANPHGY